MNILWVSSFFPFPPDNGAKIRGYFLIRELSKWNEISVFSLIQSPQELENIEPLQQICREVYGILPGDKLFGSLDGRRRWYDVPMGMFFPHPKYFFGPPSKNVVEKLTQVMIHGKYDLVITEPLMMINYLWDLLNHHQRPLMVLSELNVESLIQEQTYLFARGDIQKLRKYIYFRSFISLERTACEKFDHILVVSDKDMDQLLRLFPSISRDRLSLVPNGVDVNWYDIGEVTHEENTLIYNGALTYIANYDAVKYFLKEIFPLILLEVPQIKLIITGRTDGVDISSLPYSDHIIFTGYVSDIRPVVKSSSVCVVPLRVGGGTRLKILEALAIGTPVVATAKGAEGLRLESGRDLLIANSPEEFAENVVKLLRDPDLREFLTRNARSSIDEIYGWSHIGHKLQASLEHLLDSRVRGAG